jgi:hypothetical protein
MTRPMLKQGANTREKKVLGFMLVSIAEDARPVRFGKRYRRRLAEPSASAPLVPGRVLFVERLALPFTVRVTILDLVTVAVAILSPVDFFAMRPLCLMSFGGLAVESGF